MLALDLQRVQDYIAMSSSVRTIITDHTSISVID